MKSLNLFNQMTLYIYVLQLQSGKYYVGISSNVDLRYFQHFDGKGSSWTTKYPPISIIQKIMTINPFEEDMVTKEYMAKYGIDNVRGGSYVSITLDSIQIESITRELRSVAGYCKSCGDLGHYMKDCLKKKELVIKLIPKTSIWECDSCSALYSSIDECVKHESICSKRKPH